MEYQEGNCGFVEMPPIEDTPKKTGSKKRFWLFALIGALTGALIVLVLFLVGVFGTSKYEGSGFDTPEEAVEAYLEALKEGDAEKMLSTFAIETAAENFSFEDYYLCSDIYTYPNMFSWAMLPTDMEYGYDLAVERRAAAVTEYVSLPFFMAAEDAFEDLDSYYEDHGNINLRSEEEREEFFEEYREKSCADFYEDMEIKDIYICPKWKENLEKFENVQQHQKKWLKGLGAEEYQEMIAEVEIDGKEYYFCLAVACYDDTWYIYSRGYNCYGQYWIYKGEAL